MTEHRLPPQDVRKESLFPDLEEKKRIVQPGEYRVLDGDDQPLRTDGDRIHFYDNGGPVNYRPRGLVGVQARGWYETGKIGEPKEIVSFLYHKRGDDGNLETEERAIVLTGIGYGEHPGHVGQEPTWYLVGPQIGTFDHQTGELLTFVGDHEAVSPKNFSIACITGGPLGEPVLANPAQ